MSFNRLKYDACSYDKKVQEKLVTAETQNYEKKVKSPEELKKLVDSGKISVAAGNRIIKKKGW